MTEGQGDRDQGEEPRGEEREELAQKGRLQQTEEEEKQEAE